MADLIDRQAAIDALDKEYRCTDQSDDWDGLKTAMLIIENLPSAQPEIIRCRDCRWRKDQSGSTAWLPCRAIVTPSDFYCGRAERTGEQDG